MNDIPETAVIWVADDFKQEFLKLFEDYLNADGPSGKPKNNALVANTSHIRAAFLRNLWTSNNEPLRGTLTWWEVWLDEQRAQHVPLNKILNAFHIRRLDRETRIDTSLIVYVYATWEQLEPLTATKLPLTEIRTPAFILDTIEDLSDAEQTEYVIDLAGRVDPAPPEAPAVCHLDTGVFRGHQLISGSLASSDQHTIVDPYGNDRNGHGTSMAGLALYGDHLDDLLTGTQGVRLRHRLESVRILTGGKDPVPQNTDPRDYASGTISAVSLPETTSSRKRVYCMPISAKPDAKPGRPTLWSAAVDALAAGTNIVIADATIGLISKPDPDASRLFIVSTANVDEYRDDYLENSDLSPIEDPGQSWNALTVGAYTDLDRVPADPMFENYRPISPRGELSPHSRTSLLFGDRPWPIKPEICLEGGNVLTDGMGMFEERNPLVSLRSVGIRNDVALTSANATSAATAQAARLAALAMDRYPSYWPETIRGLLTHEAEWTAPMRVQLDACGGEKGTPGRHVRGYGGGAGSGAAPAANWRGERGACMVPQSTGWRQEVCSMAGLLAVSVWPYLRAICEGLRGWWSMRGSARGLARPRHSLARTEAQGVSGTHQSRGERDAYAVHYSSLVSSLEGVEDRLVFGRMDMSTSPDDASDSGSSGRVPTSASGSGRGMGGSSPVTDGGRRHYVGRIGLQDAQHREVILDWRAPLARAFYQATASEPMGLVRRRHIDTRARQVLGVEDEVLDLAAAALSAGASVPGVLTALGEALEEALARMPETARGGPRAAKTRRVSRAVSRRRSRAHRKRFAAYRRKRRVPLVARSLGQSAAARPGGDARCL